MLDNQTDGHHDRKYALPAVLTGSGIIAVTWGCSVIYDTLSNSNLVLNTHDTDFDFLNDPNYKSQSDRNASIENILGGGVVRTDHVKGAADVLFNIIRHTANSQVKDCGNGFFDTQHSLTATVDVLMAILSANQGDASSLKSSGYELKQVTMFKTPENHGARYFFIKDTQYIEVIVNTKNGGTILKGVSEQRLTQAASTDIIVDKANHNKAFKMLQEELTGDSAGNLSRKSAQDAVKRTQVEQKPRVDRACNGYSQTPMAPQPYAIEQPKKVENLNLGTELVLAASVLTALTLTVLKLKSLRSASTNTA